MGNAYTPALSGERKHGYCNNRVQAIKSSVSADKRGRIVIGSEIKEKDYSVSINDKGQVLLTPIVHIPEYEAWLYKNPEALELVRVGLAEAAAGLATSMDFPLPEDTGN